MSDGKWRQIGVSSAAMWMLYRTVVVNKELSQKVKLSQSMFPLPTAVMSFE